MQQHLTETELTDLQDLLQKATNDPAMTERFVLGARGKRTKRTHLRGLLDALVAVNAEMQHREELGDLLNDYADVADEVTAVYDHGGPPLTLKELSDTSVRLAQEAAKTFGLPWPPQAAWEDDVRDGWTKLDQLQLRGRAV